MSGARGRDHDRAVAREYARLASSYDTRWASYLEATIALTLHHLPEQPPERVLDVGCGTGALLAPLAERYPAARLVGVDPSREMLEIARGRLPAAVALVAGRAEALPVGDARFDLLASTSALHYFGDFDAAAHEMHRVLRPGGSLIITDWCDDFLTLRAFDRVMRLLGLANFTTLGSRALESLLRGAGFERVEVEPRRLGVFWGVMVARACKPTATPG